MHTIVRPPGRCNVHRPLFHVGLTTTALLLPRLLCFPSHFFCFYLVFPFYATTHLITRFSFYVLSWGDYRFSVTNTVDTYYYQFPPPQPTTPGRSCVLLGFTAATVTTPPFFYRRTSWLCSFPICRFITFFFCHSVRSPPPGSLPYWNRFL